MVRLLCHICLAIVLTIPLSANVAADDRKPLKRDWNVGYQISHDLTLPDQDGQRLDYLSRAKQKGLIILFSRSVEW